MFFFKRHGHLAGPQKKSHIENRRVYLANERTFLAWIRTSVAILGLGFLVEKFSFFLRLELQKQGISTTGLEMSHVIGLALIGFGVLIGILSMIHYVKREKDIENNRFRPSIVPDLLFGTIFILLISFMVLYFWNIMSVWIK